MNENLSDAFIHSFHVEGAEDKILHFKIHNFTMHYHKHSHQLIKIKIIHLPFHGILKLNHHDVFIGEEIYTD